MIDYDWLQNLKVGDKVILHMGLIGKSIQKVERITKTQIVIKGKQKYRKSDGWSIGAGKWNRSRISQWNESEGLEIAREEHRSGLIRRLSQTKWEDKSLHQLIELQELLDEQENG